MKKILFLSTMFLFIASIEAQTFMFYKGTQQLEDNAELIVRDYQIFMSEEDTGDDFAILSLESDLYLKNITENDVQATVTQTILEAPLDSENGYLNFCFLDCTTGNFDRIKNGLITANSFAPGYHANFYVYEGILNKIKVKYEVYRTADIGKTDKKTVTVTYIYDDDSTNQLNKLEVKSVLNIYQEGNQVKFNGNFSSNICKLEIHNILGQKVAQHILMPGYKEFSLPEKLTKGVYLCVIRDEKHIIASKKFIIQ